MTQSERIAKLRDSLSLAVEIYKANRCNCQKLREHLYHDWFNEALAIIDMEQEVQPEIADQKPEPASSLVGRHIFADRIKETAQPEASLSKNSNPNSEEYRYLGAVHQRVGGLWFRISNGRIIDRDQYRHDLESRAELERRIEEQGK